MDQYYRKLSIHDHKGVKLRICNSFELLSGILFCDLYTRILLKFQSSHRRVIDSFTDVTRAHLTASWCVAVKVEKREIQKNKSSIYKINKSFKSLLISVLKKTFKKLLKNLKRDFKNGVIFKKKRCFRENSHRFMTLGFQTPF